MKWSFIFCFHILRINKHVLPSGWFDGSFGLRCVCLCMCVCVFSMFSSAVCMCMWLEGSPPKQMSRGELIPDCWSRHRMKPGADEPGTKWLSRSPLTKEKNNNINTRAAAPRPGSCLCFWATCTVKKTFLPGLVFLLQTTPVIISQPLWGATSVKRLNAGTAKLQPSRRRRRRKGWTKGFRVVTSTTVSCHSPLLNRVSERSAWLQQSRRWKWNNVLITNRFVLL